MATTTATQDVNVLHATSSLTHRTPQPSLYDEKKDTSNVESGDNFSSEELGDHDVSVALPLRGKDPLLTGRAIT